MKKGSKFLVIGAILSVIILGTANKTQAQDEHERLRLMMASTYSQSSELFHALRENLRLQEQMPKEVEAMQDLLEVQGAMLEAKACDPKQYDRVNDELIERWHQLRNATSLSTEEQETLKVLYDLLQRQKLLIRQLADYHARQKTSLFSLFSK
jgi:hypothetical protein